MHHNVGYGAFLKEDVGISSLRAQTAIQLFTSIKWNIRCFNQAKEKLHLQAPNDSKSAITDQNNIFLTLFPARGTAQIFWPPSSDIKIKLFDVDVGFQGRRPSCGWICWASACLHSVTKNSEGTYFLQRSLVLAKFHKSVGYNAFRFERNGQKSEKIWLLGVWPWWLLLFFVESDFRVFLSDFTSSALLGLMT